MRQESRVRTQNFQNQTIYSFFFRGLATILAFITVPITLDYLDAEKFGVWMTISSIIAWITYIDLGLGDCTRNKVSESMAKGEYALAKTYVSTSYILISVICLVTMFVIFVLSYFLDWQTVLNTTLLDNHELRSVILIVSLFVLVNIVLSVINSLIYASQKGSINEFNDMLTNLLLFIAVWIISKNTKGNLLYLAVFNGIAFILANLAISFYYFKSKPFLLPHIKHVEIDKIREVSNLGFRFFIIQLAGLIIFATDEIIIIQILGPAHVTGYSVIFQLFSFIPLAYGILTANLWSAYTEAYSKRDIGWITGTINNFNKLMVPIIIIIMLLVYSAKYIISIWLHKNLFISNSLIGLMGLYNLIYIWNVTYSTVLKGISTINLQMYLSIIAAVINIPLAIFFAKYMSLGSAGVVLGTIISMSIFAIVNPLQTYYILNTERPFN